MTCITSMVFSSQIGVVPGRERWLQKGVVVGEQYVQCLVTARITPLRSWVNVVIVLPIVDNLSFGNYFGFVWGILGKKAGLEWWVWKLMLVAWGAGVW